VNKKDVDSITILSSPTLTIPGLYTVKGEGFIRFSGVDGQTVRKALIPHIEF
jgi:hypothetical protein